MKLILTACCLSIASGSVLAADDQKPNTESPTKPTVEQITGFGSGTGMGAGGGFGNPGNVNGGPAALNNGRGSQTFGGGFTQQQSTGSGPLSSNPNGGTGLSPTMKTPGRL